MVVLWVYLWVLLFKHWEDKRKVANGVGLLVTCYFKVIEG
jgi:hypothetical protein